MNAQAKHVLIIDGHPDGRPERYLHALAAAYRKGAEAAGHEVRMVAAAALDFPLLRTQEEFTRGEAPAAIRECQASLARADHLVIFFPLWLGGMPALLKGLLEQLFRPGFAFAETSEHGLPKKLLAGKSARIVVTMGMPAFFYKWFYRAHSLKSLERNILAFSGFAPVHSSVVGMVEGMSPAQRRRWLARMERLGGAAE